MSNPTIALGTPIAGGFFVGAFNLNGTPRALIAAPKQEGEISNIVWHNDDTSITGALSLFDGMANTNAMADAGSELAIQIRALRIGGFTDWHLPAQDQLELLYRSFIPDTCACIHGRGTLYAAKRLEAKVRSITQNWSRQAYYLKLDLANFFVAIDKGLLYQLICKRVTEPWWQWLAGVILFHDPRQNYELRGSPSKRHLVPPHKQLANQPPELGLPIGNLSSQFFANIYLDVLDQFIKHQLRCQHYIRYVDDFVLLHDSPAWLNHAREEIEACLQQELHACINPKKTILQPIDRGVDFVGQVIKPWRRTTRRRSLKAALQRIATSQTQYATANSYFGLLGQSSKSHKDRATLAKRMMKLGYCVNSGLTKIYRRAA